MVRILLCLFVLLSLPGFSQKYDWLQVIRPGGNEYVWDVAVDPFNNILSTGRVKFTSTFGSGSTVQTPPAIGIETDVFIAKYGPAGNLKWVLRHGGKQPDWGRVIASDQMGNIYIAGDYCDTASFGSFTVVGVGASLNRNIFVAKYDSSGNCLWLKSAGNSAAHSRGYGITADEYGNCYLTGHISGTSNFDGKPIGVANKNLAFVAKFNATGTCLWAKTIVAQYYSVGNDVKYKNGYIYVAGEYRGSVTIGSSTFPGNSPSWSDVFVTKLDTSGNYIWAKNAIGGYQDQANAVEIDDSSNVYICGTFANDLTFGTTQINVTYPGTNATDANSRWNIFVTKYNESGTLKWVRTVKDSTGLEADDMTLTPAGKIVVGSTVKGDVYIGNDTVETGGYFSALIFCLDRNGNFLWHKLTGDGSANYAAIRGMASDSYGNIFSGGEYSGGAVAFDSFTIPSTNGWDGFIAKLFPPISPVLSVDWPVSCINTDITYNVQQEGAPLTYSWTLAGAAPSSSSLESPIVSYVAPGTYGASLIVSNGRESDTISDPSMVVINYHPVMSLGPDTTLCDGAYITLTGPSNFDVYSWSDNSTSQSITVADSGSYFVTATQLNGCLTSDTILVDTSTCIDIPESAACDDTRITANAGDLKIQVPCLLTEQKNHYATLQLMDAIGKRINVEVQRDGDLFHVRTNLPSGMYIFQVIDHAKVITSGKIILVN